MPTYPSNIPTPLAQSLRIIVLLYPLALWVCVETAGDLLTSFWVASSAALGAGAFAAAVCATALPPWLNWLFLPMAHASALHGFLKTRNLPLLAIAHSLLIALSAIPFTPQRIMTSLCPYKDVPLPELPVEVQGIIVANLTCSPKTLQAASLASRTLNVSARSALFQEVRIHSPHMLSRLADLLRQYRLCTVPSAVSIPTIRLHIRDDDANEDVLSDDLYEVLYHFDQVKTTFSLDVPWLISRAMEPEALLHRAALRRFVLSGAHCRFSDLCHAISGMESLESLVVNATWKAAGWRYFQPRDFCVPSGLKELRVSPSSLVLMQLFMALDVRMPSLHILRLKVDDGLENRDAFTQIVPFLERFGASLGHLYVWFEGLRENQAELCKELAIGLSHIPPLYQLELFFPLEYDDEEQKEAVSLICSGKMSHVLRDWGAYTIHTEAEFWECSMVCGEVDVHDSLQKLAKGF